MRLPQPLKGIEKPREVAAWGLYDLANQSFTLLIITLFFPIFFKEIVVADPKRGDALWSAGVSVSLLIVVALSPIVGSIADAMHLRKRLLVLSGFVCAALTVALVSTGAGLWWLALLIFIPANICYQLGENLLASFLPSLSTARTIGRISAIGWAMGYAGSLLLLVTAFVLIKLFGWATPVDWRVFFVLAGVWFAIWMLPAAVVLREPIEHDGDKERFSLALVRDRMSATIKGAGSFPQLTRFLIAFFVYALGVQTMIGFAAILAADFGIRDEKLVVFTLQIAVTAGLSAILVSKIQDKIGAKITISAFLIVWVVSCLTLLGVRLVYGTDAHQAWFWFVGNGIGIGLGGIGTSSRAMVGLFAPRSRVGEFFGLWGMTYKLAGAVGILGFGQVKAWIGDAAALALLSGFFVVGLVLLMRVRVAPGIRDARRDERKAVRG